MTDSLVVPVRPGTGTMVIAICFIMLAYILDPIVQTAYRRFRAYRAWKAIQNNETVEVTDYPIVAEVLWGRGKLDTGRVVAFLTLLFSAASLALEVKLDITNIEGGPVDVFDRPPPVMRRNDGTNNIAWEVLNQSEFSLDKMEPKGFLGNFKERNETQDSILEIGESTSIYSLDGTDDILRGVVVTNSWSSNVHHANYALHYGEGKAVQKLDRTVCGGGDKGSDVIDIFEDKELRGNVTECDEGPDVYNGNDSNRHPATIILRKEGGGEYLIVEENGGYPGFFYSVWKVTEKKEDWVDVSHIFFIESRFRLVEAIITGIVYGFEEAGKCVDLMMQYSNKDGYGDETRAHPFGEHPESSVVPSLSDVEPIPRGLATDAVGISSLALLGVLSVVGIGSCLCVQSKIGMDVYDRDELIRSVTLPNQDTGDEKPSSMRMFVRKDETGHIDVIISDAGKALDRCTGYFRRPNVVAHDEPARAIKVGENGNDGVIPMGPRQRRLEGMRLGLGRTNFPRDFPITMSLRSSPLPSATCTPVAGTTPARDRAHELTFAQGKMALCESSSAITGTNLARGMCAVYSVNESPVAFNVGTGKLNPYDTPGLSRTPLGIMTSPARIRGPYDVSRRSPNVFPYLGGIPPFSRSRSNAEDRSESEATFSSMGSDRF